MKKIIMTLFCAGALALTSCGATMYSSSSTKSNLSGKGYEVEVFTAEEAKARIQGMDYEGVTLKDALLAHKGSGDDKDGIVAFFFGSIDEAENFVKAGNNIVLLNSFVELYIGKNLKAKVGSHNNVAYAGSETSFSNAF